MDKAKKTSATWNIAATHCLTAGLALPFIVNFVGIMLIALIFPTDFLESIFGVITTLILSALGIYLGVMYSVKFLNKTYVITDKVKVIKLSTIFTAIIQVISLSLGYVINEIPVTSARLLISLVSFIVTVVLFYIFSKKLISKI